jgi:hypothetical protein
MRKILTEIRMRIAAVFTVISLAAVGLIAFGAFGATPAFALGVGQMCMFDAPNGAPIAPGYSAGHVGWGFRQGPADLWTYGSTETSSGNPADTWIQNGTAAQMRAAFRNARGGHYYTKYRCIPSTPDSSVGPAETQANLTKYNGYNGLFNNCLTKAISIYNAYWVDPVWGTMGNGWATPPNNYFNNLGSDYGWGSVANL